MASHGNHHYEGAILVFATGPFTFTLSFPAKDGVGHGLGQATLTNFTIPLLCLGEALSVLNERGCVSVLWISITLFSPLRQKQVLVFKKGLPAFLYILSFIFKHTDVFL